MFKVGSKVKCVRPVFGLVAGDVYTVITTKRETGQDFVLLSGAGGAFWYCNRFVLVNAFKGNIK